MLVKENAQVATDENMTIEIKPKIAIKINEEIIHVSNSQAREIYRQLEKLFYKDTHEQQPSSFSADKQSEISDAPSDWTYVIDNEYNSQIKHSLK
jgi:hypothetical protein